MGPRQAGPGLSLAVLAQRCWAQLVGDGSVVIADGTVISGATGVLTASANQVSTRRYSRHCRTASGST
ncbi:MAG: hypothetical protein ABI537_06505 [Casimicrobiaceae bacterium]